ncbi:conserved hypothetical protein [Nostocoides japonicum T1-X7]|uniref:Uncharacterized protein n=1 Tax=Nostocoides japonicum T1-X7 TaxID=1194083 RepID=A0A077LWS2_9MICO|nr:transcriptional regulator [Tetrasphaera japonica]CCH76385.1 conserved hypothetical protein [Tetrasphaera japonica T1-X7]
MPGAATDPVTLTLHAVRLLGFGDTGRVAARFALDREEVEEHLLDFEAFGWVRRSGFARHSGWSLTPSGRAENERRLAAEIDGHGLRAVVADVHARFVPLNAAFQDAATRWQVRPFAGDPLAVNDHQDVRWDDRVLESLASVGRRLGPLNATLVEALARFGDYSRRYDHALNRVVRGDHDWVDQVGVDSCHVVWMQLHEDLLATLQLERGQDT